MAKAASRKPRRTSVASDPESPPRSRLARPGRRSTQMVFGRRNYVLLLIGLALVIVGYAMMRIENEVDGFLSLYLAPLLILGGYLEVIYAILWRPKEEATSKESA